MESPQIQEQHLSFLASERLHKNRIDALEAVDNAHFGLFHVRLCVVAGIGFFTDAYDIFAISIASTMLGSIYGASSDSNPLRRLNSNQDLGIKVSTLVGTLVGQLIFGWLADHVGRKKTYGLELVLIIFTTFTQAIAGNGPAVSVIGALILWRFLMGIGVGGDYPISAVISSEFANVENRGRLMLAVFSSQGWGQLAASIVAVVVTAAFKDSMITNPDTVDYAWRILIGVGCIPGVIALYFRLTVPETPRFTLDIDRNIQQACRDLEKLFSLTEPANPTSDSNPEAEVGVGSWKDFKAHFSQWKNMKVLISTAYSWFALDIAFYGLNLNTPIILSAIGYGKSNSGGTYSESLYQNLKDASTGNLILTVAGLIPGYGLCFLLIDRWGRKPIQLLGFCVLTVLYIGMGFGYNSLKTKSKAAFFALYCIAGFFQSFGPNSTTFIIPAEIGADVFPTRYRSTVHGISAASGKLGAIIAECGFAQIKAQHGESEAFLGHILEICAFFMLTGIFSTLLVPETKGRSLDEEELSKAKEKGGRTNENAAISTPPPLSLR
ncbi:hypothetical protein GYMLUDRAFT_204732 [Collybiopsis luxurians FD-317 M1]|uniref:Major facilitator superfamily (MFS) profile domain-containing protein n=1 Tax=Collybiopsis luxurians FD-317 M1 TaxID=944289 RepID=A0A0D0B0J0_9AGAR|nr:hypothetical protein GYMLUDRAFT_204732 [Collybiopsis luxurians FD-317 M1]